MLACYEFEVAHGPNVVSEYLHADIASMTGFIGDMILTRSRRYMDCDPHHDDISLMELDGSELQLL